MVAERQIAGIFFLGKLDKALWVSGQYIQSNRWHEAAPEAGVSVELPMVSPMLLRAAVASYSRQNFATKKYKIEQAGLVI